MLRSSSLRQFTQFAEEPFSIQISNPLGRKLQTANGEQSETTTMFTELTIGAIICVVSGILATAGCLHYGKWQNRKGDCSRRVEVQVALDVEDVAEGFPCRTLFEVDYALTVGRLPSSSVSFHKPITVDSLSPGAIAVTRPASALSGRPSSASSGRVARAQNASAGRPTSAPEPLTPFASSAFGRPSSATSGRVAGTRPTSAPETRTPSTSSTFGTARAGMVRSMDRPTSASSQAKFEFAARIDRPTSAGSKVSTVVTDLHEQPLSSMTAGWGFATAHNTHARHGASTRPRPPEAWSSSAQEWRGPPNPKGEPPRLGGRRSAVRKHWWRLRTPTRSDDRHRPPNCQAFATQSAEHNKNGIWRQRLRLSRCRTTVKRVRTAPGLSNKSGDRRWRPWRRSSSGCSPTSSSSWASARHTGKPRDASAFIAEMRKELESTRNEPLAIKKNVFRELQRQLHPDKNADCEEAAKLAFQELMQQRAAYLAPPKAA